MKRFLLQLTAALTIGVAAHAQTDITTTITPDQAAQIVRIAVPFPELKPPSAPAPFE